MSDAYYEGGSAYVGVVAKWEVSVLSCHFYSTYLTALKNKVLFFFFLKRAAAARDEQEQMPETGRDEKAENREFSGY